MKCNLLTIFTPSYNRAYILPKLYESLLAQNDANFEWVIVDDGSVDETEMLVDSWVKENRIRIVYKKQKNQGKHIAINTGVSLAKGELFFIVDSDDTLTNDAVFSIRNFWAYYANDSKISGIVSYRLFPDGGLVGTKMPESVSRCKLRDTKLVYGSTGDKVVIYRTEIMRQYPYPKFEGEKFFGESYVFNQIDDKYDMVFMHHGIYVFDYQTDGLSQDFRKLYRNNPKGMRFSLQHEIRYQRSILSKIKMVSHVACLSYRLHDLSTYFKKVPILLSLPGLIGGIVLHYKIFIKKESDVKPFVESENK